MSGFDEYRIAAKMRDVIRSIVQKELDRLRPAAAYATVITIDVPNRKAQVRFPEDGDEDSVWVGMGTIQPTAEGQTVRVAGPLGDRYIDDVMDTPGTALEFAAPVAAGPTNVEGTAETTTRSDHVHAGGIPILTSTTRPVDPIDGETIIESDGNRIVQWTGTNWRRGPGFTINGRTGVYLFKNTPTPITTGGAATQFLNWDTELLDTDGFTAGATITCPGSGLGGFYLATFHVIWDAVITARTYIELKHTFSGGNNQHRIPLTGEDRGTLTVGLEFASGDTLLAGVWQNSGASVDVVGSLSVYRLFS